VLRVAGRRASIPGDDRSIDLMPSFRLRHGLQPSANRRSTALIDAAGNQFVDLSEEFFGDPYCNLLCRHTNQYTVMGCLSVCAANRERR
jgi:hypothetical protein